MTTKIKVKSLNASEVKTWFNINIAFRHFCRHNILDNDDVLKLDHLIKNISVMMELLKILIIIQDVSFFSSSIKL